MSGRVIAKSDHGGWLGITLRLSGTSRQRFCAEPFAGFDTRCVEQDGARALPAKHLMVADHLSVLMRPAFLLNSIGLSAGDLPRHWLRLLYGSEEQGPTVMPPLPYPGDLEPTLLKVLDSSAP